MAYLGPLPTLTKKDRLLDPRSYPQGRVQIYPMANLLQGPRRLSVQSKLALRDIYVGFKAMKKVFVCLLTMAILLMTLGFG